MLDHNRTNMANYKPSLPFNVPAFLLKPTRITVKGVTKKIFTDEEELFFCSFRTFGGTEKQVNDMTAVENTAVIETWYEPKFTSDCNVLVNGVEYEIISPPENINMQNQYVVFKVRALKGGD